MSTIQFDQCKYYYYYTVTRDSAFGSPNNKPTQKTKKKKTEN